MLNARQQPFAAVEQPKTEDEFIHRCDPGVEQRGFSTLGMTSDSSLWALRVLLIVSNNRL